MAVTNRFALTLMATSSLNKEAIFNENMARLDTLVQPVAKSATTTTPPGSPTTGDLYIVPTGATGAWAGQDQKLAAYLGGWVFFDPKPGVFIFAEDTQITYRYDAVAGQWTVNSLAINILADVPDVDTTGLTDGMVLIWDAANSKWIVNNAPAPDGATLESILDTYYGDTNWRTQLSAAQIETLLDAYYGGTGWRDTLTAAQIKTLYESNADTNAFTDAEKTKLAGLQDSLFLGVYTSLANLQAAHPSPPAGSYGYVDAGNGTDITIHVWDDTDSAYVEIGTGGTETAASIKTKYESNPDTNAFTDAEKAKLAGIEDGATADLTAAEIEALLDAYYGNTNWRTGGGASVSVSDEGTQVLAAPTDINFTGAGVTVTDDTDGTVTVDIPGGGASSGYNTGARLGFAKWTPPPSAGWISLAGEGASLENGYDATTQRVRIRKAPGTGGSFLLQPVASGSDFERILTLHIDHGSENFGGAGIFVYNQTTDKGVSFIDFRSLGIYRQQFTGSAFDSEGAVPNASAIKPLRNGRVYFKVARSGGTMTVHVSLDGIEWVDTGISEDVATGWLGGDVTHVGLYAQTTATSTETNVSLLGWDTAQQPEARTNGILDKRDTIANYTVTEDDLRGNVLHKLNSASAQTVTVPAGLTGTEPVTFVQLGAGQVSFVADTGVTINSANSALNIASQYSSATLIPLGSDTYVLIGNLS